MRKLLLSTVSVAALVTLAACSDETAQVDEVNPTAAEETAGVDNTGPAGEGEATVADNTISGNAMTDENATANVEMQAEVQPGAGEEPGVVIVDEDATATAEFDTGADIEEAKQAVADARDAIQQQSEAAAVQALIKVERAIDNLESPAEAQEAVDTVRNEVIGGDFEAALAALSDVEMAIDANAQANATFAPSDETTASTTE